MKKIFIFIALVMGMVCGMNAQVVNDTMYHNDSIQFTVVNDTNSVGNVSYTFAIVFDSTMDLSNAYVSFVLDGLTSDMRLFMKIGDTTTGAFYVTSMYDTTYTYVYGDSIVRVDTIFGGSGHPGVDRYDTIYNVIDTTMVIDTVNITNSIFYNGLVNVKISDYLNVGFVDTIEFYVVWDSVYSEPINVTLYDVNVYSTSNELGIDDICNVVNVMIYPNPTSDYVNIVGDVNVNYVNVIDINGRNVIKTNSNVVDMKNLDNGIYFIRVMFVNGDMRTFKVCKY